MLFIIAEVTAATTTPTLSHHPDPDLTLLWVVLAIITLVFIIIVITVILVVILKPSCK